MNFIQSMVQFVEVGKAQSLVRLIPLGAAVLLVGIWFDWQNYHGLNDAQSMDNAQLARQIVRGSGFTTEFLRPHAVTQLRDYALSQALQTGRRGDLFPPEQFPPGTPRILPDTYNAPGYPYLLATWFYLVHPEFEEPAMTMGAGHAYSPDRWIPPLNQIFLLLTALMVFILGFRLFDERVAWLSLVAFFASDIVWRYSVTALSTSFLMFLVTAAFLCALEVVAVGEACFRSEERSFAPAWIWSLVVGIFMAAACLTRLHLAILLVPLFVFLMFMPRASVALPILIALVVGGCLAPWFIHVNKVCGNPLGSNMSLLLYGQDEYQGNQIFCATSLPSYEQLFRDASKKEYLGFRFHLEHGWELLGSNPMILLFGASVLHQFKRRRTSLFQWLLFGSAFFLIAANNLGVPTPENVSPWNTLIVLFPCMMVIGGAFFFILLDRLSIQIGLLNLLIVTTALALTAIPLVITAATSGGVNYNFPPYLPPFIKILGQYAQPDEWVTSDMPWATAWYSDRASLWLPDSIADFENLHDNVCPTGLLLLTPVTWAEPLNTFKSGEYKDWYAFAFDLPIPTTFPLQIHTVTAQGTDYSIWSDRPRWQSK